jgi:hypothetical protein
MERQIKGIMEFGQETSAMMDINNGQQWTTMDNNGQQWTTMNNNEQQQQSRSRGERNKITWGI